MLFYNKSTIVIVSIYCWGKKKTYFRKYRIYILRFYLEISFHGELLILWKYNLSLSILKTC